MVLFEIFKVRVLVILRLQLFLQKGFIVSDTLVDWNLPDSHCSSL